MNPNQQNLAGNQNQGGNPPAPPAAAAVPAEVIAFLGAGNQLLPVARTINDISTQAKTFPKDERKNLKQTDFKSYLRMVEMCKSGLENKFALLDPITEESGVERLSKTYNVLIRIVQLKKEIENCDMNDVFEIPLQYQALNGIDVPSSLDKVYLLETDHNLDIELVKKASKLYALHIARDYHPQNIAWSGHKILNSCEADLKEKIIELAEAKVPTELHGGPVYLFLMRRLIIATSEKAMRSLTERITVLKLSAFPGENVLTAGSYLKGAFTILTLHDRMPTDVNLLLFRIFKESSTPDFNAFVIAIEQQLDTAKIFGNTQQITHDDLIGQFETKYSDLIGRDAWLAKSTTQDQASAFVAQTGTSKAGITLICFNCGGLGHAVPDCPKPKNDEAIKARRDLILNLQKKGGGGWNNSNTSGRGNGGGRGRGRGRGGGHGNGGGRGRGGGGRGNGNTNENGIKTPPRAGESHQKSFNGVTKHWCGRCGKWGDHDSANHPSSSAGGNGGNSTGGGSGDNSSNNNGGNTGSTSSGTPEGNLATTLSFRGAVCGSLN